MVPIAKIEMEVAELVTRCCRESRGTHWPPVHMISLLHEAKEYGREGGSLWIAYHVCECM